MDSNQLKHGSVWFLFDPQNDITEKEWTEICEGVKRYASWTQIPEWLEADLSWAQMGQWLKGNLFWDQTYLLINNIYRLSEPVRRHFRLPHPGEKFYISI